MMSAYSAASHGHAHPRILAALTEQAHRLAVPSRAYYNDRLGPFLAELCRLTGLDAALPMNTGAEAVETAIKAARRWGYRVKGVPHDQATIIVADGNFHGRTTTIVGFSSEPAYRDGFGPFTPGFRAVPFGDLAAIERAISAETVAVLVEPIQGEAGIVVPPAGWLRGLRQICDANHVLLILDEVQSGLGRTGAWFAFQHEGIVPDGLVLGKALGGGVLPVSAFVGRRDVMDVFTPGSHGSTFGGNPLAAAVGLEALHVIADEGLVERSRTLGAHMLARLRGLRSPALKDVRGRGLWAGAEIDPNCAGARAGVRAPARQGRAVEGHPRHGRAPRAPAGHQPSRSRLGARSFRGGTARGCARAASGRRVNNRTGQRQRGIWDDDSNAPGATALSDVPAGALRGRLQHQSMDEPARLGARRGSIGRFLATRMGAAAPHPARPRRRVDLVPPAAGLPDLVFTANSAVVLDRKVLLARFRHPERQAEEAHYEAAFRRLQAHGVIDTVTRLPDGLTLEGAGDCVFDQTRGVFWMGYGPRSDQRARTMIADHVRRPMWWRSSSPTRASITWTPRFARSPAASSCMSQARSRLQAAPRSRHGLRRRIGSKSPTRMRSGLPPTRCASATTW